MYYFIVLVVVVLVVIWYYCYIRQLFNKALNALFPPCTQKKIEVAIPIATEDFKDDISKHISFTENSLKQKLF